MEHAHGRQLTHVPGLNQDPELQAMEMFVDIRGEKSGMAHQGHHKINNVPQLLLPRDDEPDTSLFKPNIGLKFPNQTKAFVSDGPTVPVQPRSPDLDHGKNFMKKLCIDMRNDRGVKLVGKKEMKDFVEKLPQVNLPDVGVIVNEDYDPQGKCYSEDVHYIETEKLSKGSFGKADLCIDTNSEKQFVKKTIEKPKFNKSEVLVPINLNHENLTKMIGVIQRETEDGKLMIELMLEYGGKALNHYLVVDNNLLTQSVIWDLTRQGLQGLAHMDTYSMVHLDIKPENMVVQQIGSRLLLKITDFGSAKLPHEPIKFVGWTPEYMAPEMCKLFLQMRYVKEGLTFGITEADITGKVDVNAFGLVVMYMYKRYHLLQKWITQGETTYKNYDAGTRMLIQQNLMMQVAGEPDIIKNLIPDECDLDMRDLLGRMTCHNHHNRLGAKDALLVIEDRERKMQLALQQNQARLFIKEEEVEPVFNWEALAASFEHDNLPVSKIIEDNPERGPIKSATKDRLRQKLKPKPYDGSGKMTCGKPSKGGKITERLQSEKRLYSKCFNQPAPVAMGTMTGRHSKVMMEPQTPVDEMLSLSIKYPTSQMSEKYNTPVTQPQESDMDVNEGIVQRSLGLPVVGLSLQQFEPARQEGKTFSLHQGRVYQKKPTPDLVSLAPKKLQLTPEFKQAFLRKINATSLTPASPNVMASTPSIPVQPTETSKTFGAVAMDTGIFQNVSSRRRRVVQPKTVMQVEQEPEFVMPDAGIAEQGNMPRFDFL